MLFIIHRVSLFFFRINFFYQAEKKKNIKKHNEMSKQYSFIHYAQDMSVKSLLIRSSAAFHLNSLIIQEYI